jgi:hypothetical protein
VILEEIWILVEVDGFEREFPKALSSIGICCGRGGDASAAKLRTCPVLEMSAVASVKLSDVKFTW